MATINVEGGYRLEGKVRTSGAKNAALIAISAALLANGPVYLENIPRISDVLVMLSIIEDLGAKTEWESKDCLVVYPPATLSFETPYDKVKKMRASNVLLGPLLAKAGKAHIALPGGCNIGSRPMDLHIKGLTSLGAEIVLQQGVIKAETKGLSGARIYLDFPSVGATENIMMAAVLAQGQTIIENAAKEPEIVDLANLLNAMGAKVRGTGTDVIKIEGVPSLSGVRYAIIPDRIEAGTFMVAAAATGGDVLVENVIPTHLEPITAKLREANIEVIEQDDTLRVIATNRKLRPIDIKTLPYPGFPTDMQSQMMAMLTVVPGTSIIVENVFENRLQVADELKRLGAKIKIQGRTAVVEGISRLEGTQVRASDLRAGAALIVAGLTAEGTTEIDNVHYIDRGYENLEEKFVALGAKIYRK